MWGLWINPTFKKLVTFRKLPAQGMSFSLCKSRHWDWCALLIRMLPVSGTAGEQSWLLCNQTQTSHWLLLGSDLPRVDHNPGAARGDPQCRACSCSAATIRSSRRFLQSFLAITGLTQPQSSPSRQQQLLRRCILSLFSPFERSGRKDVAKST